MAHKRTKPNISWLKRSEFEIQHFNDLLKKRREELLGIRQQKYWDELNSLIKDVIKAEDNPHYSLEMDISILPTLASLALTGSYSLVNLSEEDYEMWSDENDFLLEDLHFLAANNRVLPSSLNRASWEEIRDYALENKDEILEEIRRIFEDYYDEYYK